ncbi:MAG: FkbM family methyltransferase [Thermoanaerobaculia bacterium]
MNPLTSAKRLAVALLSERPLNALRTVWHRAQVFDPRQVRRRFLFRRLNRDAGPGEIVLRPGLRLAVEHQARESFEWFCFRSEEMAEELDAFLARLPDRRRFLDVGAFHGLFSLAFTAGRPDALAVAVDPSPPAWEVLEDNLRRNPEARVTPVRTALGAGPGVLTMRYSWHHLEATPGAAGEPGTVEIPVRTLDALCGELGLHPDLMKIDVEGYEIAVLQGAARVLREDRPVLFLEVHPQRIEELGGSMAELAGLLADHGYEVFGLRGAPVRLAGVHEISRFRCEPA